MYQQTVKKYLIIVKKIKIENYLRPKKFSSDKSNIVYSVFDCIEYQKKNRKIYDVAILLQPTSPVRSTKEIIKAVNNFERNKIKSMMSVCKVREHPNEIIQIKKKKEWSYLKTPNKKSTKSNNYKPTFILLIAICIFLLLNF